MTGSEGWISSDDLGGLQPGSALFGAPADLDFILIGIPAPGALALLGLAGLAGARRRGASVCVPPQAEPPDRLTLRGAVLSWTAPFHGPLTALPRG